MFAAVSVGAVAIAADGAPAAGAGVTSSVSTTAGTAATSATASTVSSGLTAAKALTTAQKIATGLKVAGKVGSATGMELPDQLMQAADFVANPKGAAMKLAMDVAMNELQQKYNLTLDAKGQDALKEKIRREQQRQAAVLRLQAKRLREAGYARPKTDWAKIASIIVPFVILFLQKG